MYYLQSRYYDPALGRFINADVFTTTDADGFLSCNMFAYCENDPINRNDPGGQFPLSMVVGGLLNVATTALAANMLGLDYTFADALVNFGVGALNYSGLGDAARIIASTSIGLYSLISAGINGASLGGAIAVGTTAFLSNYFAFSTLSNFNPKTLSGFAGMASLDLTFGFGSSIVNTTTMLATTAQRSSHPKKKTERAGKVNLKNNTTMQRALV